MKKEATTIHKKQLFLKALSFHQYMILMICVILMALGGIYKIVNFNIDLPWQFTFQSADRVGTIFFGMTAGVLSLIGLLSIFVSLNSQHRIEKSRELYWLLSEMPFDIFDTDILLNKMKLSIRQYLKIRDGADYFVILLTKINQFSISVVCFTWSIYVGLISTKSFESLLIAAVTCFSILILLCFHGIMGQLQDIDKIGDLPPLASLLDVNDEDVSSIYFLPKNLSLSIVSFESGTETADYIQGRKYLLLRDEFKIEDIHRSGQLYLSLILHIPVNNFSINNIKIGNLTEVSSLFSRRIKIPKERFEEMVKGWDQNNSIIAIPLTPLKDKCQGIHISFDLKGFQTPIFRVNLLYEYIEKDQGYSKISLIDRQIQMIKENE
jgi:hypothetical protein